MAAPIATRQKRRAYRFIESIEGVPLEMVLIPAGSFQMGAPETEAEISDAERPQHQVTIAPFFMGRYPVTQAQWRSVAQLPQINLKLKPDPSRFKGENHPVEQVSWKEAVEFCDRLTQSTGRPYRLPSEAEWEYACRAGTTTPFYFGDTISTDVANYYGRSVYGRGEEGEYRETTTPVDYFNAANDFGLSDMHGNVWEWCADHWHENYEGAPDDGAVWSSSDEGAARVIRGGSWDSYPRYCRSASRLGPYPDGWDNNLGFRVVCSPPRTP